MSWLRALAHQTRLRYPTQDKTAQSENESRPSSKKHNRSEDSEEGDEDGLDRGKRKKADVGTSALPPRFLACPYWKRDPRQSQDCCKLRLRRIRDVKQHLHRRHTPEFYCERCFAIFLTHDSHQHHIMSVLCTRLDDSQLDGISHAQRRALSKKSNPGVGEEAQWYTIWAILFPSYEKPSSAYIDSGLSADLCLFREHWQRMGPEILLETLRSHRWPELSAEEQEVQGRRILTEGLDRIYEGWLLTNMLSGTSISSSNSDIPSVNSPNQTVSAASSRTSRISPLPMQAESIVIPVEADNNETEHFQTDFAAEMANWGAWDLEEINPYTETW